ncbi:MAG: radical SAM protein [bacterium]
MQQSVAKSIREELVPMHRAGSLVLPESYNYIGVFLTFRCPFRCSYCINRFNGSNLRFSELSGREWIEWFDRLNTRDVPITLQGGEPGSHRDFIEIVAKTIQNHPVDILTNLEFDLARFVTVVNPVKMNRPSPYAPIRVSYHPEQFSLVDILGKVRFLRDEGFRVGLYGVMHPENLAAMEHAAAVCADLGIDFRTKPFLGWHNNVLHGEYAYPGVGSPGGKTHWCECAPTELLAAPDGSIHRCHSFLYAGRKPLGHVTDRMLKLSDEYLACNRFGNCNPCDMKIKNNRFQQFGHVAARIRNIR